MHLNKVVEIEVLCLAEELLTKYTCFLLELGGLSPLCLELFLKQSIFAIRDCGKVREVNNLRLTDPVESWIERQVFETVLVRAYLAAVFEQLVVLLVKGRVVELSTVSVSIQSSHPISL